MGILAVTLASVVAGARGHAFCFSVVAIQLIVLQPSRVQPEVSSRERKALQWPHVNSSNPFSLDRARKGRR